MHLYLIQHGEAKLENEDPERRLTDRGADDVARVARYAVDELALRPRRLLHSGKTRARQTAEIWGGVLGVSVDQADALAPNDDPTTWAERVDAEEAGLMLVGHLPHLDRLVARLVSGDADRSVVRFRPGGLVGLERTDACWVVSVVVPPDRRRRE